MKVLMLGWELPPHNSGGLGTACYQLCKELARSGVDIDFILPYDSDHRINFMNIIPAVKQSYGYSPSLLSAYDSQNYSRLTSQLYGDLFNQQQRYEAGVESIVKYAQFDIIHAHDWLTFEAALKVKKISGKPLIAHVHATEYDRAGGNPGNPAVEEIEYNALTLADKIVAVSEYTKQVIMKHYGIPSDKIEVVHNSIDISAYNDAGENNVFHYLEVTKASGWSVIGSIGRLTVQKGLTNLLRATSMVIDKVPKTFLLVVGSGDQREELIMLAAELGIASNVLFVEFLRGQAQRNAFEICDIFAMPSISEPFGITPLESIGFGVPALVSKQSGVAELVKNLLKIDCWDVNAIADQLHTAITSPEMRNTLRDESYKEFEKLSWKASAQKLQRLYDNPLLSGQVS